MVGTRPIFHLRIANSVALLCFFNMKCNCSVVLPRFSCRPPLSRYIQEEFIQRVPAGIFTTNPARIQYGTKEIVLLREDILTKMCRNSVHIPTSENIPMQVTSNNSCSHYFSEFKQHDTVRQNARLTRTFVPFTG